jgi:hypothetical protein
LSLILIGGKGACDAKSDMITNLPLVCDPTPSVAKGTAFAGGLLSSGSSGEVGTAGEAGGEPTDAKAGAFSSTGAVSRVVVAAVRAAWFTRPNRSSAVAVPGALFDFSVGSADAPATASIAAGAPGSDVANTVAGAIAPVVGVDLMWAGGAVAFSATTSGPVAKKEVVVAVVAVAVVVGIVDGGAVASCIDMMGSETCSSTPIAA